ncbi:FG-GAP repeat-containing protein [Streptomyces sp. KO7888]|uniref:FG-GAP repeat protein n=1 Tax=Streptomyces sp. KO7888 TaxID=2602737 RepID=UPI0013F5B23E|nr:FG-GAP repeat protein [Streptomyces sp. KO7888]NHI09728.1 FG-GAP repeat-containing protein [Streptomyces sp. KO7888]
MSDTPLRGNVWCAVVTVFTLVGLMTVAAQGSPASAVAACEADSPVSDFNGDGVRDMVIADPEATVGGKPRAGAVTIVYGGAGPGPERLDQDSDVVRGSAQAGAEFGFSLAQADMNGDGCSDLIVGAPYTDVAGVQDAGAVHVLYGDRLGLAANESTSYDQGQDSVEGGAEPSDLFGYAVAAQRPASGVPYLAVGIPGEDLGSVPDAGAVDYLSGGTWGWMVQDAPGVAGTDEVNDRFGSSLASTPSHLVVGAPGEAIGAETFAGAFWIFGDSLDSGGRPEPLGAPNQESPVVGVAESGDRYGTSIAAVPMPDTSGTYKGGSYVVVGSPGEALGDTAQAGSVSVYKVTAAGTVTTVVPGLHQNVTGTAETAERADHFGQQVAAAVQGTTLRVAAGVPGEESGPEHTDKGGVQIFTLPVGGGLSDAWIDPGYGIPGEPAPQMYVGVSLGAAPDALLVGAPYGRPGTQGAVYAFDWTVASGGAATQTYEPGAAGIPAGGTAFGAAVR